MSKCTTSKGLWSRRHSHDAAVHFKLKQGHMHSTRAPPPSRTVRQTDQRRGALGGRQQRGMGWLVTCVYGHHPTICRRIKKAIDRMA
eukprot:scaffold23402_cov32-Tisochrysis_lutea.AAC.1